MVCYIRATTLRDSWPRRPPLQLGSVVVIARTSCSWHGESYSQASSRATIQLIDGIPIHEIHQEVWAHVNM